MAVVLPSAYPLVSSLIKPMKKGVMKKGVFPSVKYH